MQKSNANFGTDARGKYAKRMLTSAPLCGRTCTKKCYFRCRCAGGHESLLFVYATCTFECRQACVGRYFCNTVTRAAFFDVLIWGWIFSVRTFRWEVTIVLCFCFCFCVCLYFALFLLFFLAEHMPPPPPCRSNKELKSDAFTHTLVAQPPFQREPD